MRKWKMTLLIMATACGIVGCSNTKKPDTNTVSIQKDGSVSQTIVDQFERNYYDVEEFSAMAQEKIERYSNGTGNIVCESVETKDGKIFVTMTYQSGLDYTNFNNRELFNGTVEEAAAQGYELGDIVAEDGTGIDDAGLADIAENHVVVIQTKAGEELAVNVYDKILYISSNVTLSGKQKAVITAGEEDMISCIVFK